MRATAAATLGFSPYQEMALHLGPLLRDPAPAVRANALLALGLLPGPGLDEAQLSLSLDLREPIEVREAALFALGEAIQPGASPPLVGRLRLLVRKRWRLADLFSGEPEERKWRCRALAARVLGKSEAAEAREDLEAGLADPDPWVREEAALALGWLKQEKSLGPLINALDQEEVGRVRKAEGATLDRITGLHFGEDRAVWRAWWLTRTRLDTELP